MSTGSGRPGRGAGIPRSPVWDTAAGARADAWATRLFGAALVLACLALAASTGSTLGLWDETYYANWIDTPNAYGAIVQPFGLFLHPAYALFGRSLVAIRLLGLALLVATGAVMGRELRLYAATVAPAPRLAHLPLAGGFAALLYYVLWSLTPSYNLLANAGGALVLAGGFGWAARDRGAGGSDWLPSLCCGLGGAVVFLGKPTSAVLAGALVGVQLVVIARRDRRRALSRAVIAGTCAAVPVAAVIRAAMPFDRFAARIGAGVGALGADYSMLGLLGEMARSVSRGPWYVFASVMVLLASAAWAHFAGPRTGKVGRTALIAASLALLAMNALQVVLLVRVGIVYNVDPWSLSVGTSVVGLFVTTAALGVNLNPMLARDPRLAVPLLLLAATPYLIAFGTANDILRQAGMSLFPVLVAGVLCARLSFPLWLTRTTEAVWVVLGVVLLGWSALRPYNQPAPVFASTVPTALPFTSSRLRLDPATARYARDLRALARSAGITADTPVLDLSGVSPGTVALLGARAPFFPWIIAFSKRPSVLAVAAWQSLSVEEQRRTWIVGPIDRRFADDPVIARLAASGRYRRVAVLRYAPGAGRPRVVFWAPASTRPRTGA